MKERIDIVLVKRGIAESRNIARNLIKEGKILVDGEKILKPSNKVNFSSNIEILERPKYVSRGGLKLEKAIAEFNIDPQGLVVIDVGSSTGGFTDCLLQKGAKHIYSVDVGKNQLAEKLREDKRVSVYEKTDIRNLETLPEKADLITVDVSFISLRLVLPHLKKFLKQNGKIIALLKPQFEAGPGKTKKGVIKEEKLREEIIENMKKFAEENSYKIKKIIESPLKGASGNIEYFLYLERA